MYFFLGWHGWFILLADQAMLDSINYLCVHAWPLKGTTEGAKQLVPPVMPQGIVHV